MTQIPHSRGPDIFDAPVSDPDHDLLGIKPYAERLADFVDTLQPPFTIGVYGAWGAGKTSFVGLMKAALKEKRKRLPGTWRELKFISFNAWPFKTSDDLWRALVQKIAYDLHEMGKKEEPAPLSSPPYSPLASPPAAAPATPAAPESWRTRIGKLLRRPAFYFHRETPPPGEHDAYYELMERLDETAYGGLRRTKPSGSALDDEATLLAVVQGTVAALGSLSPLLGAVRGFFGFGDKVDVAQLLRQEKNETTRNRIASVAQFRKVVEDLFEAKAGDKLVCIFIDDLDRVMPDVAVDLLEALKIFLGETRCIFIVAADEQLIGEGLRIRYKELLQLSQEESPRLFARKGKEYFEKIIQLAIRVPEPASGDIHRFLAAQFPHWLPTTDLIQNAVGSNPRRLKQYCTWLTYKYMVARDPQDMQDDSPLLNKLIELRWWSPAVVEKLRALTEEADFQSILQRLERCLRDSTLDEPRPSAAAEIAHPLAVEIYQTAVVSTPLHRLFTTDPLLSSCGRGELVALSGFVDVAPEPETATMLRSSDRVLMRILEKMTLTGDPSPAALVAEDLGKLFALGPDDPALPELLATIPPEVALVWSSLRDTIPDVDAGSPPSPVPPWTRATLLMERLPPERLREFEAGLVLRIRAARHFIKRRRFVKVDALAYSWPEFAGYLRTDLRGVRAFESNAVDPEQKREDLPPRWQTFYDEKLSAFLRLRPLLRDIFSDELGKLLDLTGAVVTPPQPSAPPAPEAAPAPPARPVAVPVAAMVDSEVAMYRDVHLTVTAPASDNEPFAVAIEHPDPLGTTTVQLDSARMQRWREETKQIVQAGAGYQKLSGRVRELGQELCDLLFQLPSANANMFYMLGSGDRYRFHLHLSPVLEWLPWELLYAPMVGFLGLAAKHSIVRSRPGTVKTLRPFVPPLRILAVFTTPGDTDRFVRQKEEADLLTRTLEPAGQRSRVQPPFISFNPSSRELEEQLTTQRPHVVHFVGRGIDHQDARPGFLMQDGVVAASKVAAMLAASGVTLAVVNANVDRGEPEAATGFANAFVDAGIPAVLATMRPLADDAALRFTRDFYRPLAEGLPVEAALGDARQSLSAEKMDWSAFALFGNGSSLDHVRLELPDTATTLP